MNTPYDFLVIDCHNLAYRNWWHRRELKTSQGVHTGLEYGFLSGLQSLVKRYPGAIPILVWDGIPTRCLKIFPVNTNPDGTRTGYKANRTPLAEKAAEPDWITRFITLRYYLHPLVHTIYHPDQEADEEIARLVLKPGFRDKKTLICSNDIDLAQLVTETTHLYRFTKDDENKDLITTPGLVQETLGIPPGKIPLWKAITGDSSDNISGVPRIPNKVISAMVTHALDFEGLLDIIKSGAFINTPYQLEKLQGNLDLIRRNHSLVDLSSQAASLPTFYTGTCGDSSDIRQLCQKLEMDSLADPEDWVILEKSGCKTLPE